jgi:hypothetical protein
VSTKVLRPVPRALHHAVTDAKRAAQALPDDAAAELAVAGAVVELRSVL